jgi:GGDEF domain-containing protein
VLALEDRRGAGEVRVGVRKAAERRIAHMAGHDALTDLPNRSLFRERLRLSPARPRRARRPSRA